MWSLVRSFLPVDLVRAKIDANIVRIVVYAVAGLLGLIALLYLLESARYGLMLHYPAWLAALIVGGGLIVVAGLIVWIGLAVASRRERRLMLQVPAAPPMIVPAARLAGSAAPVAGGILARYPRQLVVIGLVAGALMEMTRKRG